MKRNHIALGLSLVIAAQSVLAAPSIGSGGGGAYATLRDWLQNFVDFMAGPFGLAVIILSIVIAFVIWAVLPKEGILAPVMRVVVSAIVIFNIGTWLTTFS